MEQMFNKNMTKSKNLLTNFLHRGQVGREVSWGCVWVCRWWWWGEDGEVRERESGEYQDWETEKFKLKWHLWVPIKRIEAGEWEASCEREGVIHLGGGVKGVRVSDLEPLDWFDPMVKSMWTVKYLCPLLYRLRW